LQDGTHGHQCSTNVETLPPAEHISEDKNRNSAAEAANLIDGIDGAQKT
jgi:hypothetical protein